MAPNDHAEYLKVELHRYLTDDALGERGSLQSGEAQVSDLHAACWACDEDVVALKVSMNDWGGACVQKVQAFEDLSTPAPQDFGLHHFKALQIAVKKLTVITEVPNTLLCS